MDDIRLQNVCRKRCQKLIERAFEHTLSPDELENAYEMFKIKYQEILLDNAHIYDGIKNSLIY